MVTKSHEVQAMIDIKLTALALIFDGIFMQLAPAVKARPYSVKLIRAIKKKNMDIFRRFSEEANEAYELAESVGKAVTDTDKTYASITGALAKLIEKEPRLISHYKLNQNLLDKLFASASKSGVIFQTSRFSNEIIRQLDIEFSYLINSKGKI